MKLQMTVALTMLMREGETQEQAFFRLVDLLRSELCNLADHHIDYIVECAKVVE